MARAAAAVQDARFDLEPVLPALAPRRAQHLTRLWLGARLHASTYPVLSERELLATRRSDTAFVFGSGRSLVDIDDAAWTRMALHDSVGFSHFHRQRWIRVDYHLFAEIRSTDETAASIRENPRYADTVFGLMRGWTAEASNELVARRLLPPGVRTFRWRRIGRSRVLPPSRSLADGLVHGTNTILDVVNFALLMGWRRIVIAGVDLYNKEYFWLPAGAARPDEKPHLAADSRWPQADEIIATLALWRGIAEQDGVELLTYDARSLLAEALPVFAWEASL